MTEPLWLDRELILLLHDDILAAPGGAPGVRDTGLLDSALARPLNRFAYEGLADLVELAATYAVAIASNIRSSTETSDPPSWRSACFWKRTASPLPPPMTTPSKRCWASRGARLR